jgi:hypothetical protein
MNNMNSYQPAELGAIYDSLPSTWQEQVAKAVESFDDSRKESQINAIQELKKADSVNSQKQAVVALNDYLAKGDTSENTYKAILDGFAKEVIREGLEKGLEKASVDLTFSASGNNPAGLLNQAYGNQFFMNAKKQSDFFNEVDMFQMRAKTQKVDRFIRGSRFLYPSTYDRTVDTAVNLGRALKPANYFGYTVSKTEFAATALKGVLRIPKEDLMNNITGANLLPFLLGQAQMRQVIDDMSDQILNGDTALAGSDADSEILRQKDGLLKLAGYTLALAGTRFNTTAAINAKQLVVDPAHQRRMDKAKFYLPQNAKLGYLKELGALATSLGDTAKLNGGEFSAIGTPVIAEDYLPMATTTTGFGLLVDPKVVKLGIWDSLQIEADYDPNTRDYLFYVYTEYDFKVLEPQQIVKITGLSV